SAHAAPPDPCARRWEGLVGIAGFVWAPAVVIGGLIIMLHVGGLWVFAERRVITGGAGRLHRAQRLAMDPRLENARDDQPVGLRCGLLGVGTVLLDHGTKDVGYRFVQRARLSLVGKVGGVAGHAVGQLMAHDIDSDGKALEDLAVAV